MEKINSAYIIGNIFSYIKDNKFMYNLLSYSKKYQKKFSFELIDYQKIYYDQNGLNSFIKYLISNNYFYLHETNKSELFEKYLLEYNININEFKNYINKYFKKYKKEFLKIINGMKKTNKIEKNYNFIKMNEGNKLIIGIYSSLFEIIYNSNIIEELFIIDIYSDYIYTKNSLDKYTSNFHKLNNNLNISSIKINFNKSKDINYLKDLNINQLKI